MPSRPLLLLVTGVGIDDRVAKSERFGVVDGVDRSRGHGAAISATALEQKMVVPLDRQFEPELCGTRAVALAVGRDRADHLTIFRRRSACRNMFAAWSDEAPPMRAGMATIRACANPLIAFLLLLHFAVTLIAERTPIWRQRAII